MKTFVRLALTTGLVGLLVTFGVRSAVAGGGLPSPAPLGNHGSEVTDSALVCLALVAGVTLLACVAWLSEMRQVGRETE